MSHSEFVVLTDATLTTDSIRVAKRFGKSHKHVMRAIRGLIASAPAEFTESNFGLSEFTDSTGRTLPMYRMTKDGFMLLAMGFTGDEAMKIKVAFINAFNAMAEELQQISASLWAQRQALEMRDMSSFVRAQFGSRLMSDRRKVIPEIKLERARLEAEMQPSLIAGVLQ